MIDQSIFRNYDIRGVYGAALTEQSVYRVAHAYAAYANPKTVAVGADARLSSPALKQALIRGLVERGIRVVDIGLVSTDAMYFSSWFYGFDGGIMVTASHMPKEFNGLKFLHMDETGVLLPIGRGLGMEELESYATQPDIVTTQGQRGSVEQRDIWKDFVAFTRSFVDTSAIRPFHVVMDAGNGMGGFVAEKVFANLPLDIIKMCFEPDGNFPNHPANPIIPENRTDIIAKMRETRADIGVAWDADCDRVYFIDETGTFVDGDFIATLLARSVLQEHPGAGIVYDLRFSRVLQDHVERSGGVAHISRVGHTYIKHKMRETASVFGGEVSGHYYFAKNTYMENGFAPVLMILEMMSKTGKSLSKLVKELGEYYISGEVNFAIDDREAMMSTIEQTYSKGARVDRLDGLSFFYGDWHFNVRPSANDPVLRLTMEANSRTLLDEKFAELSSFLQKK